MLKKKIGRFLLNSFKWTADSGFSFLMLRLSSLEYVLLLECVLWARAAQAEQGRAEEAAGGALSEKP
jgi:hypothetical protein